MAESAEFKEAAEKVRNLKNIPPPDVFLKVYSLYKQATMGDCNIECPSDEKGKAKYEAWNSRKGMSQEDAAKEYIEISKTLE